MHFRDLLAICFGLAGWGKGLGGVVYARCLFLWSAVVAEYRGCMSPRKEEVDLLCLACWLQVLTGRLQALLQVFSPPPPPPLNGKVWGGGGLDCQSSRCGTGSCGSEEIGVERMIGLGGRAMKHLGDTLEGT